MRRLPLLIAPLLLVLAAGCGSSSSSSSSQSTKATTAPDGAAVIHMRDIQFEPKDVTVKVGQKVRWINDDNVQHNVIADSGAHFRSHDFGKGETYTYTPTRPGTITYECDLHPGMDGTLNVVAK